MEPFFPGLRVFAEHHRTHGPLFGDTGDDRRFLPG
jgi:hypothetical protein